MIEQILIILLVIFISFYITFPYFFGYKEKANTEKLNSREMEIYKLENLKNLYLNEIKDIEFDYGLGKLSEDDYRELLSKYKLKTAGVIKAIDEIR